MLNDFFFRKAHVANSTLSGNLTLGRYAYGRAIDAQQRVTMTNSTFKRNFTTGEYGDGGTIDSTSATIKNTTISGNTAVGHLTLQRTLFVVPALAGIFNRRLKAELRTRCAVVLNDGGAVFSYGGATVVNSTIVWNQAQSGSGIQCLNTQDDDATMIRNSIVSQNSESGPNSDVHSGWTVTVTNSLIGNNAGTSLVATTANTPDANGNFIGSATSPIDPLLGP